MKFNKITIVILSVSIIALSTGLVLISQNVAYGGAPGILGGISANPASTISNKGTQYAIVVEPATNGGLVKSVVVNKAVLKRDKKINEEWQNSYYQELFSAFKKLVSDHNKIYQFKADDLINKITQKQSELKRIKAEIKQLEAEKELKANA